MLKFDFGNNFIISIDFSFFAVIAIFLFFDHTGYGIYGIFACLIHEAGHLVAMLISASPPCSLHFYAGGIRISSEKKDYSIFVALSGCLFNFLAFIIFFFFTDRTSIYPLIFASMNLLIGLFNLLPIGHLDGRLILENLLLKCLPANKCTLVINAAEKITIMFVLVCTVFFVLNKMINLTVIVLLIYIIFCDLLV